jgi:nitroreductase
LPKPTELKPEIKQHAMDALLQAYRFRRAIKRFDPAKPVAEADWQFILEAARLSPSSMGLEAWDILDIQSPDLRQQLIAEAQAPERQVATAPRLIAFTAATAARLAPGSAWLRHIKVDLQAMPEDVFPGWEQHVQDFLRDKLGIAGNDRAIFDYSARQAYIALGNMLTAAAAIGVESCPLEGLCFPAADRVLAGRGLIDLDQERVAVLAAFGYRAEDPHREQCRRPMSEIVRTV